MKLLLTKYEYMCINKNMAYETASKMYESARDRLKELIRQEAEFKEQISHWGPIVEQLAKLSWQVVDPDIASIINELRQNEASASGAGQEMGLTEAIRWVFRQPLLLPLTPTQVRDHLAQRGYELDKYKYVMPPIHNTLKRMKEAGEIREVGWAWRDRTGVCERAVEDLSRELTRMDTNRKPFAADLADERGSEP
jgi:hypothetical protein